MNKGILGRKIGMTSVFTKDGKLVPVTVVVASPNVITQVKTIKNDGYEAIQIAFEEKREKLVNKPQMGHFKKANTTPKRFLREVRGAGLSNYELGSEITIESFTAGEIIDVTGTSKGKGFQGVIKRYNQTRGPMGHGSQYHRGVGSMGTLLPMRVIPGKKLPGHMGNEMVTIQNLEVINIDLENNIILIKGSIPGANNSLVYIHNSVKHSGKVKKQEELVSYEIVPVVEESLDEEATVETTDNEKNSKEENLEETNEESSQEA